MTKKEIMEMTDSELFSVFYGHTVLLVKEANSVRGETKKTTKEFGWIVEECIARFSLDREMLIKKHIINN